MYKQSALFFFIAFFSISIMPGLTGCNLYMASLEKQYQEQPTITHPILNDGRVLSIVAASDKKQSTIISGTDGGGIDWGPISLPDFLPKQWHYAHTGMTPDISNDRIRLMALAPSTNHEHVLYAATYNGLIYSKLLPNGSFHQWKTSIPAPAGNQEENRLRSVHIAYGHKKQLETATLFTGSDKGLWSAMLDSHGMPGKWEKSSLDPAPVTSIFSTGNQNGDIVIVGTKNRGIATGIIQKQEVQWQYWSEKDGLPSDFIWNVYATGKALGDIILIGSNGNGIGWATIQGIDQGKIQLSPWYRVNDQTPGFGDNCNAQVYLSGSHPGSTAWIATRSGLSCAVLNKNRQLTDWRTYQVPTTTNDIGCFLLRNNILYLGIYRTGIAATKLNKKGIPQKWYLVRAKHNNNQT